MADEPGAVTSEEAAVALAQRAIDGKITPRPGAVIAVARDGDTWQVEWTLPPEPRRGPDFEARVRIDAATGEILEILAGA